MRRLEIICLVFILVGCAKKAPPPSPDRWAPKIQRVSALNRRHLRVIFTENIDPASGVELTNYSCTETNSDVPLRILTATTRGGREIDLTTSLQSSVSYTLAADGITDDSGNEMGLQIVKFEGSDSPDTHPPRTTEIHPPAGSVSIDPDSGIIVRFSESMDTASIRQNSGVLPRGAIELHWDDPMTEFRFSLEFQTLPEVYTLYLKDGCRDLDGNQLQEWQFLAYTSDSTMPSGYITFYLDGHAGEPTLVALVNSLLEFSRLEMTSESTLRMNWIPEGGYMVLAGTDLDGDKRFDLIAHEEIDVSREGASVELRLTREDERWKIFDRLEAFFVGN